MKINSLFLYVSLICLLSSYNKVSPKYEIEEIVHFNTVQVTGMKLFKSPVSKFYMFNLLDTIIKDWANLERFKKENKMLELPKKGEIRVVFMGNSITQSWLDYSPDFFKKNNFINRGISGQTTPQMLLRFRADVIDLQPKVVVILAGTNDIAGNTGPMTLDQIFENIVSMVVLANANNIKVVVSSVLPAHDYPWRPGLYPNKKIPKLNKMLQEYAIQANIIYLDYFSAMVDDRNGLPKKYSQDGVHPSLEGYKVMEPLVELAVKKALQ